MVFILILLGLFSSKPKEKPVAIVGSQEVFMKDIPEGKTIEKYVRDLVLFFLAKEKGYDDSVRANVEERFNREVIRKTFRERITRRAEPTPYECVVHYINSGKELKIQLIQTDKFSNALKAYLEIMVGKDFGSVAEKYSSIPELKEAKGEIKEPLKYSPFLPVTIRKIFNLKKGEVSFPIKYASFWNIIKVIDVQQHNVFDRGKIRGEISGPKIKGEVSREKASIFSSRLRRLIEWLVNTKINSKGLSFLWEKVESLGREVLFRKTAWGEEELKVVLARSALGEYTINDLIEDINAGKIDIALINSEKVVADFIADCIRNEFLVVFSKRLGAHRDPYLIENYNRSLMNSTVDFFRRKEILSVITENDDELKTFYEANKEKYRVEEKRKVYLIEVQEEKEAQEIRRKLLRGAKFEVLAKERSIGIGKKRGGEVGYIGRKYKDLGEVAFLLKKGEISKPFKTEKGWAIIKVTDIKESYIQEYSKVKGTVAYDYRKQKAEEIENEFFERNKERIGVKIFL
ncbi:MAG: peptidyl-prolyl cis-trans isomerase [candidate division WOR-3 bacterium]